MVAIALEWKMLDDSESYCRKILSSTPILAAVLYSNALILGLCWVDISEHACGGEQKKSVAVAFVHRRL